MKLQQTCGPESQPALVSSGDLAINVLFSILNTNPKINFAVKCLQVVIKTEVTHPGKSAQTDNTYLSYPIKFSSIRKDMLHAVLLT